MPIYIEQQTAIYAVITGDIVGSTKLSSDTLMRVRETLSNTIRSFSDKDFELVIMGPEFYRGDSWQVLLNKPRAVLRLALLIQARLLADLDVETRVAIGIGTVSGMENNVATSTGEAFTLSGHALEGITGNFRLTGMLPARAGMLATWFPAILHLCDGLMSSWTRRQAEAMGLWLSLVDPTHAAIAGRLSPPVTQQSVTDILTSANLRYLYEAMKAFHTTDWQRLSQSTDGETGDNAGLKSDRQMRLSKNPGKGKRE
jgi:hypothetical protein